VTELPANPALSAPYPPNLALELVLKSAPPEEILDAYGISVQQFVEISKNPAFAAEYKELAEKAKEEGFSYRIKARAQSEAYLKTSWDMVQDKETPPSVRADLIKWTGKMAELEPNPKAGPEASAREQIVININLGDGDVRTIDGISAVIEPAVQTAQQITHPLPA